MIKYETIINAKNGDDNAICEILLYYIPRMKKYSLDEDFIQKTLVEIMKGIKNFQKNKIF